MARYLVIFKDQINDIDVNGFKIMTDREIETLEQLAASIRWGFSYSFGDTKLHLLDGEDLLSKLEYKEISNDESKAFKKLFNGEFGVFVGEDYLQRIIQEESDETIENDEEEERGFGYFNEDGEEF